MGETFTSHWDPPDERRDPVGNLHSTHFHAAFGDDRYALMELIGFPNSVIAKRGWALMAGDQFCRFFAPVRRGDSAVIVTTVEEIKKSSFRFRHNVYRKSDNVHTASGYGITILVSLETKKATEIPDDLRQALGKFLADPALSAQEGAQPNIA